MNLVCLHLVFTMETSDSCLLMNRDWDPTYLSTIFEGDFYDFSDLWQSNVNDMDLVNIVNEVEKYSPIVEDISMDDNELCSAVERIELE